MKHAPGFLKLVEEARPRVVEVECAEVARRLACLDLALVDIREDHEWLAGHARGARHLGKGVIERDIEAAFPDKDTEIVLYCGGGYRSILAADSLQRMGYSRVRSLIGGWRGWTEAGLPVDREAPQSSDREAPQVPRSIETA